MKVLQPDTIFTSPRYAPGVRVGNTIYTAGRVPIDVDGEVVAHTVEGSGSQVLVSFQQTEILEENAFHEVDVTAQDVGGMPLLDEAGNPTGTYNWVFWVPFVY